jgi:hypothetical protein
MGSTEARPVPGALVDEVDRPIDDLDRLAIGLLGRVAPHDQTVLGEDDELEIPFGAGRLTDLLGEREAGPDVRDPGGRIAEALAHEPLAVRGSCQHVDAVGVGVVDVRRRYEGVQQRLDRGAWHRRVELAAREIGNHRLVAHLGALHQRQHLVHTQAGEVLRSHRREVAARALDPHHRDLTARVVDRRALGRRISPAEVRHGPIGAEQMRREHELVEGVGLRCAAFGPEVVDAVDDRGHRAHRAISWGVSRSVATRSA